MYIKYLLNGKPKLVAKSYEQKWLELHSDDEVVRVGVHEDTSKQQTSEVQENPQKEDYDPYAGAYSDQDQESYGAAPELTADDILENPEQGYNSRDSFHNSKPNTILTINNAGDWFEAIPRSRTDIIPIEIRELVEAGTHGYNPHLGLPFKLSKDQQKIKSKPTDADLGLVSFINPQTKEIRKIKKEDVEFMKNTGSLDGWEEADSEDVRLNKNKLLPVNFEHPSREEFEDAVGSNEDTKNTPYFAEENLVPFMNEKYDGTNVRFVEANVSQADRKSATPGYRQTPDFFGAGGYNAIEILVGDQQPGEGKIFPIGYRQKQDLSNFPLLGDGTGPAHTDYPGSDDPKMNWTGRPIGYETSTAWDETSQEYKDQWWASQELNWESSYDEIMNYIDGETNANYKEDLINELAENYFNEDMAFMDDTDESIVHTFQHWDDQQGIRAPFDAHIDGKRNRQHHEEVLDAAGIGEDDRSYGILSESPAAKKAGLEGDFLLNEIVNSHRWNHGPGGGHNLDGHIVLENGRKITYREVWKMREQLRERYIDNRVSENMQVKLKTHGNIPEDNEMERVDGKYGYTDSDGNFKTIDELEESLSTHILDNISQYFPLGPNAMEDTRISEINDMIENIEARSDQYANLSDEDAEEILNTLKTERTGIIQEKGYDKMELYDTETGMFIGHEKKDDWVKDGYWYVHKDTGEKIPAWGNEEEAESIADDITDVDVLKDAVMDKYLKLIAFSKISNNNIHKIHQQQNRIWRGLSDVFDANDNSLDNLMNQLQQVAESNDIFNLYDKLDFTSNQAAHLSPLPEDSHIGKEFNRLLDDFVTYGRALKLNIDPTKSKKENYWSATGKKFKKAILTEAFQTTQQQDEAVHSFEDFLAENGYETPVYLDEGFDSRGHWWRQRLDAATQGAADLAPILMSIYGFNKATGYKNFMKQMVKNSKRWAKAIAPGSRVLQYSMMAGTSGVMTVGEWAMAEGIAEQVLGSEHGTAWKSHTLEYDPKSGTYKLNWMFPFAMGSMGVAWQGISKITSDAMTYSVFGGPWKLMNNMVNRTGYGNQLGLVGKKLIGEPVTAANMLTFASWADHTKKKIKAGYWPFEGVDENTRQGQELKEEWERMNPLTETGFNAYVETYLMMGGIGMGKFRKNYRDFRKAQEADILLMKNNTVEGVKADKELGIKDSEKKSGIVTNDWLNNRVDSKIKKTEKEMQKVESDKKMSAEQKGEKYTELQEKIESIKKAKFHVKRRNNVLRAKIIAKRRGELGKFLVDQYINTGIAQKIFQGELTVKDREKLSKLGPVELDIIFDKMGIEAGGYRESYASGMIKSLNTLARQFDLAHIPEGSKAREFALKNNWESTMNTLEIERLQADSKKNPKNKSKNQERIKTLNEKNKNLQAEFDLLKEDFAKEFKKAAELQLAQDAIQAKKLGVKFEVMSETQYKKKLKELGKEIEAVDAEAFIINGNSIFINRKAVLNTFNIGAGLHEITHALLKNSLKEISYIEYKGKSYTKRDLKNLEKGNTDFYNELIEKGNVKKEISKNGKRVIDDMISKLSKTEKQYVQTIIDQKYRYEENIDGTRGKEKRWQEYYEEYITVMGQGIKAEIIQRRNSTGRNLSRLIFRPLKKYFPKLYEFDINRTKSEGAIRDLFDMVQEIQDNGLTRDVLKSIEKDTKKVTGESQSFHASKTLMEKIDKHTTKTHNDGSLVRDAGDSFVRKYKNNKEFQASKDRNEASKIFDAGNRNRKGYGGSASEALDRIIFNSQSARNYAKTNNLSRAEFIDQVKDKLKDRYLRNYNYDKNPSIFGWLYSKTPSGLTILEHARGDVGMAKGARKGLDKVSMDVQIGEGKTFAETFMAPKETRLTMFENQVITLGSKNVINQSKLRKKINLTPELVQEVKQGVEKAIGAKLPDVRTRRIKAKIKGKDVLGKQIKQGEVKINAETKTISIVDSKTGKKLFEQKLSEYEFQDLVVKEGELIQKGDIIVEGWKEAYNRNIEIQFKKLIQEKVLNTEKNFELFLEQNFEAVFDLMPVETLVKWERSIGDAFRKKFPNAKRIFTEVVEKNISPTRVDQLIREGRLSKDTPRTSGPSLYKKLPYPGTNKVRAFFRGVDAKGQLGYELSKGTPGNRKDGLAVELSKELAFDATYEVLMMPEVIKKRNNIIELTGKERLQNEMAVIMKNLNREPGIMFSKTMRPDLSHIFDLNKEIYNEGNFRDIIEKINGENVLVGNWANRNINQATVDLIAKVWESGKVVDGISEGFKEAIFKSNKGKFNDIKQILLSEGTFERSNTKLIKQVQRDLKDLFKGENAIPKEIMDLPGFWDMLGFHTRIMPSAKRKRNPDWKKGDKVEYFEDGITIKKDKWLRNEKGEYISDPHYKFKQNLIKEANKQPSNPQVKRWVKDAKLMNKKFSLFNEVDAIRNAGIKRAEKIKRFEKLRPEIIRAGEANINIHNYIIEKMISAINTNQMSKSTFVHILQAQANIVGGFRALSRLDIIDFRDGSQAVYKYTNKKGEVVYTNDATRKVGKEKVKNEINRENPDLNDAIEFYTKEGTGGAKFLPATKKLPRRKNPKWRELTPTEALEVALKNLTTKGEHLAPSANTNVKLVEIMLDAVNGKYKNKKALNDALNEAMQPHSQLLTSKYICDLIDKGGKNNPTDFHRIKFLDTFAPGKNYINNLITSSGKNYYEFLSTKELTKTEASISSAAIKNKRNIDIAKAAKSQTIMYSKSGKKKGMSTFDFDDTLARTKSGVRVTVPNPSGLPKPKRKVIFLAGGAGSGKSNVVKKLGLEKDGFKIVNSDISLEWLKKNNGLPENMRELTKEQRSLLGKLGHQARKIAKGKMMKYQGNAEGVVVDGTGGSMKVMEKMVAEFKEKGYDVSMLFVETTLETAMARNRARKERSLLDIIVEKNHVAVQSNKPGFKNLFGERFMEVKTDNLTMESPMPSKLVNKMNDFVRSYEKLRLDAEQFALQGESILNKGGKFDFVEFNKVVEGTEGPYLKNALEKAKKFGTKDMFVLTARPAESAKAIHQFLKNMGLEIPLENITGLGNSTGEAKAKWMLEKFSEGYNDMYFVDDALGNVKAVKKVLENLDIKSKVVQAKIQFSKNLNIDFNNILERNSKGKFAAGREITIAEARAMGKGKGRFDYFVPPSAEDFKGLIYKLLGKGEQGNKDMRFFKKALFDPFAKGIRDYTIVQQKMVAEYKALKKASKDIKLNEKIQGTEYTVDMAIRAYLFTKAGYELPGMHSSVRDMLVNHVNSNPKLIAFANTLSGITRVKEGYQKPSDYWMIENIGADLNNLVMKQTRKEFLAEWIQNKNEIFSEANLNKLEAIHGKWYREALENILTRMEAGTNRLHGIKDGPTKLWYDWVNGAVGATMFWNTRSAALQTISMVNFTNMAENNIAAQAKAFANQKQFWKDFAFIFNSPMLRSRRGGLAIDVSAAELTSMFEKSGKDPRSILKYMLEKGFTPTRIADSFAIAMGGSGYYRNRLNMYLKRGLTINDAKKKAFLDFQEIAEETQQSSRPDLISQQQAGPLGRIILAWQNTPMQMTRLMKKKLSDLVNRRKKEGQTQFQSDMANMSGILYYGALQNLWFGMLQSGLAWMMFGSDMEDKLEEKSEKVLNGAFDTLLRGTGIYGAAFSTMKNTILRYYAEKEKPKWKRDQAYTVIEALNLSPPIGSKVRKGYNAIKTWEYNEGVGAELGFRIENPDALAVANIIEGVTNIPLARMINKANNLEEAITGNHETWQRIALAGGWSRWNIGVKDEELEEAKEIAKEKNIEKRKQEKIEKEKQEEEEKKRKGLKKVRCSGIKSNGERCSLVSDYTRRKTWKCTHHMEFKDGMDRDGDGIKEYQCTATTKSGRRCRNKTENKNKKCYAHQ